MLSKSVCVLAITDTIIITLGALLTYYYTTRSFAELLLVALISVTVTMLVLNNKGFYSVKNYSIKDIFLLFEATLISSFIVGFVSILVIGGFATASIIIDFIFTYIALLITRTIYAIYKNYIKPVKNVLIVGAGQDGKIIAEEIQARPELGFKVVGFLDDNMNNIEEEDSTIPILGLTCDSDAVIKDNKVDMVIVAVKSRMDSNILTDLAKGIPLGVKVWRMPTFYSHLTKKLFTSKMSVNWLFYDYVRPKHILYSYLKRVLDLIMSVLILIITSPLSIIAIIGIKLSDFGPVFFTQVRMGKFGRPFKMVKFRTMYQDKVDDGFDDDLEDIENDDKRIMPFCKWIRKFHVDDIPQMLNIIKGDMSLIGPRPVREDVYYENSNSIPFWECRSWVRPGWTGWQQVNVNDCTPEERLAYDLYYVKRRTLLWEVYIFIEYFIKVICGQCK